MTAGELIARADELRPNGYGAALKRCWLRRLDGQILAELEETHRPESPGDELPTLPDLYADDTELLAPFPWGEGLYLSWLFCQIDLHNGEIQKYNQSLSLLAAAWRALADWINRRRQPRGPRTWRV